MQRALVLGASSLDGGGLPSRAAGDGTPVAGGKRRRDMGSGVNWLIPSITIYDRRTVRCDAGDDPSPDRQENEHPGEWLASWPTSSTSVHRP
jgi:hypothetical protein